MGSADYLKREKRRVLKDFAHLKRYLVCRSEWPSMRQRTRCFETRWFVVGSCTVQTGLE